MCCSVASYGEKSAITLGVSFAGELQSVARAGGGDDVNVEAFFAEASECRAGELSRFAATSSGIDDGEETLFWRGHWGL